MRRVATGPMWPVAFTLTDLLVVLAIIAISVAMLVPAAASARERAQRVTCATNLDQMGKALASYQSDYGLYYPGGWSWATHYPQNTWAANSVMHHDSYKELNLATGGWQRVYLIGGRAANCERNYSLQVDYGCIAIGDWSAPNGSCPSPYTGPPADSVSLKAGPWGLGWLIRTGYNPEVESFYCPSASGKGWGLTATGLTDAWSGKYGRREYPMAGCGGDSPTDTLEELRNAANGRITDKTLTCGRLQRTANDHNGRATTGHAVYSQYAYRNQPTGEQYMNMANYAMEYTIAFTKPAVLSTLRAPIFKTSRKQADRALVSDSFNRDWKSTVPGFGMKAHVDGYNVLYGDYHNEWFEDSQRNIIWWQENLDNSPQPLGAYNYGVGIHRSEDYSIDEYPYHNGRSGGIRLRRSPLIWHLMDRQGDMDLSVNPDKWVIN